MRNRQCYIVRKGDLTKLVRYNRPTKCGICDIEIKIGDEIKRTKNTYHKTCYEGSQIWDLK